MRNIPETMVPNWLRRTPEPADIPEPAVGPEAEVESGAEVEQALKSGQERETETTPRAKPRPTRKLPAGSRLALRDPVVSVDVDMDEVGSPTTAGPSKGKGRADRDDSGDIGSISGSQSSVRRTKRSFPASPPNPPGSTKSKRKRTAAPRGVDLGDLTVVEGTVIDFLHIPSVSEKVSRQC